MNLSEFKAWFEGFTENLDGKPDAKQWARIKAKIGEIKDAPPTSYPVFVDRYWNYPRPWYERPWYTGPYWAAYQGGVSSAQSAGGVQGLQSAVLAASQNSMQALLASRDPAPEAQVTFNSGDAFRALGRADAESMRSN